MQPETQGVRKLKTAEARADRSSINTLTILTNEPNNTTHLSPGCVGFVATKRLASPVRISTNRTSFLDPLVGEIEDLTIILKESVIIRVAVPASTSTTPSRHHDLLFVSDIHVASHRPFHSRLWQCVEVSR